MMRVDSNASSVNAAYTSSLRRVSSPQQAQSQPQAQAAPAQVPAQSIADKVQLSPLSVSVSKALQMLDASETVRPSGVEKGKEAIRNWKSMPGDVAKSVAAKLKAEV